MRVHFAVAGCALASALSLALVGGASVAFAAEGDPASSGQALAAQAVVSAQEQASGTIEAAADSASVQDGEKAAASASAADGSKGATAAGAAVQADGAAGTKADEAGGAASSDGSASSGAATGSEASYSKPAAGDASASDSDSSDVKPGADDDATPDPAPVVKNGWVTEGGLTYYYVDGKPLTGELYIPDEETGEWHWYYLWEGQGGAVQTGWSWVSDLDKWCYYDEEGRMEYGQQCLDGLWYRFNEDTGQVTYGFSYIADETKWVFYDRVMGWMLYGQQSIDDGWYYLTPVTGAVDYDWAWLPDDQKWVYYDSITGRMLYGQQFIDNHPYYFDTCTGRLLTGDEERNMLLGVVYGSYGVDLDCMDELAAAGGTVCPYGPCMSYVWWCFHHAGLDLFLCDGMISAYPHENYDWYDCFGRVDYSPRVGDIAFMRYPGWADAIGGVSASHAGIVIAVSDDGDALVVDALSGGIWPRWYSVGSTIGFAHPYWN